MQFSINQFLFFYLTQTTWPIKQQIRQHKPPLLYSIQLCLKPSFPSPSGCIRSPPSTSRSPDKCSCIESSSSADCGLVVSPVVPAWRRCHRLFSVCVQASFNSCFRFHSKHGPSLKCCYFEHQQPAIHLIQLSHLSFSSLVSQFIPQTKLAGTQRRRCRIAEC